MNAYLVAENIAQQLVKRIAVRKTMKRAIQSALRLGAKGIRVCLSGRLAGHEIGDEVRIIESKPFSKKKKWNS